MSKTRKAAKNIDNISVGVVKAVFPEPFTERDLGDTTAKSASKVAASGHRIEGKPVLTFGPATVREKNAVKRKLRERKRLAAQSQTNCG